MILAKDLKSVYENHKDELMKMVAKDQNKPIGFEDLVYSFSDLDGKKYYSFTESTNLPIERLAKLEEYQVLMTSGLHNGRIDEITTYMDNILSSVVNTGLDDEVKKKSSKNLAKLGLLIQELKTAKDNFIPVELFYSMLAVQLVREDENIYSINDTTIHEKVIAFQKLSESNGGFFFGLKELKLVQSLSAMSENEWNEYWKQSKQYHEARKKALRTYLLDVER